MVSEQVAVQPFPSAIFPQRLSLSLSPGRLVLPCNTGANSGSPQPTAAGEHVLMLHIDPHGPPRLSHRPARHGTKSPQQGTVAPTDHGAEMDPPRALREHIGEKLT